MSLFNELKRRNVIRVTLAYVVTAWLIIQVAETILPAFGFSDVAIRYLVIVLAIAFILALVFSWVFEITPEGIQREVDVIRESSITRYTGKRLDRIIMVLLALGMGYFAFDKFVLDPVENVQIAESAHQEGRSEALGALEALRIEPQEVWMRSYLASVFAVMGLESESLAVSEDSRGNWRKMAPQHRLRRAPFLFPLKFTPGSASPIAPGPDPFFRPATSVEVFRG